MSTQTAVKIQTRTWTGNSGIVRHYITNLAEVIGSGAVDERRHSAWINPDGTWDAKGFNNGDWFGSIAAAVKAHNAAEQVAETETETTVEQAPTGTYRIAGRTRYDLTDAADVAEYVAAMLETGELF